MTYSQTALGGAFKVSPVLHSACTLQVRQRPPRVRVQNRAFCLVNMQEVWKPVPGYEGLYEVSDQGRVRSLDKEITRRGSDTRRAYIVPGKLLSTFVTPSGHVTVHLARKWLYVHRIVLTAFVGAPTEYAANTRMEGRHLDGNPANNVLENLAWGTVKENRADRRRLGEKAKLSLETARLLQEDARRGLLLKDIAAKYGIDRHTVARYRDGRMYGRLV